MKKTKIKSAIQLAELISSRTQHLGISRYGLAQTVADENERGFPAVDSRLKRMLRNLTIQDIDFAVQVADAVGLELVIQEKRK